jgi:hypothetical protein
MRGGGIGIVWIGGGKNRGSRELTDRDVIGVSIRAVGIERDNHMRADAPQMSNDFCNGFGGIRLIEVAINVIEEAHLADAEFSRGVEQFRFADLAERFQARIVLFVAPPAAFAARGGDEICLDSLGGILRQRPAHAQGFIVGMSENAHQAE